MEFDDKGETFISSGEELNVSGATVLNRGEETIIGNMLQV